jgi:hypothetical protein
LREFAAFGAFLLIGWVEVGTKLRGIDQFLLFFSTG